jgi:hypothetical protein
MWLWKQQYGAIPRNKRVVIIDPAKATTIDNLKLVNFSAAKQEIGQIITRNFTRKGKRAFVKIGDCKWQPLETYLWIQTNGRVPDGKYVKLIDPNGPVELHNLQLEDRHSFNGLGQKNLDDWFVVSTLSKGKNKEFGLALKSDMVDPDVKQKFIEAQRANLVYKRELKAKIKEFKNAGNTQGSPPDNEVEGAHTEHE